MDDRALTDAIRRMLLAIVQAIVDQPAKTAIVALDGDGATCFRLTVAERDFGMVIGKQGRMARAIRTILGAASMQCGRRFTLDITEDGVTARNDKSVPQQLLGTEPRVSTSLQARVIEGQ